MDAGCVVLRRGHRATVPPRSASSSGISSGPWPTTQTPCRPWRRPAGPRQPHLLLLDVGPQDGHSLAHGGLAFLGVLQQLP